MLIFTGSSTTFTSAASVFCWCSLEVAVAGSWVGRSVVKGHGRMLPLLLPLLLHTNIGTS